MSITFVKQMFYGDKEMEIDQTKIVRRHSERSIVYLGMRIKPSLSRWLRQKNYSPKAILIQASIQLGYKPE